MSVAPTLEKKGNHVYTLPHGANIRNAVKELAKHHIGVLFVTGAANELTGIVSKLDVIRELADIYFKLGRPISTAMTRRVSKCSADETED